jgi:hypothetical protein
MRGLATGFVGLSLLLGLPAPHLAQDPQGGAWHRVRTVASPGDDHYRTTWGEHVCTEFTGSWSDGRVAVTNQWPASRRLDADCENSRDMQFAAHVSWAPPPQHLVPGTRLPIQASIVKTVSDVSRWGATLNFSAAEIRRGNPVRICRLFVGSSGTESLECTEPFEVPQGRPGATLELRYEVYFSAAHGGGRGGQGQGHYTYFYEWGPAAAGQTAPAPTPPAPPAPAPPSPPTATPAASPAPAVVVGPKGRVPGDTTGSGDLTALDAMNALKMSVQLLPEDLIADLDGDRRVTARDATLILQRVVGR